MPLPCPDQITWHEVPAPRAGGPSGRTRFYGFFVKLSRFANSRYAPGTPSGICR
jgi:hypothetical protein